MAAHEHHRAHKPADVQIEEADWQALADQIELEGELLLGLVTDSIKWACELRGRDAPPVRRVLDIGSGPGVGTCELARLFPDAHVVAVDGSPAMLDRTTQRAAAHDLGGRISTLLAELPDGLDGLDPADLIWASMSLHHVGDEVAALRVLRDLLGPSGVIATAERAEPMAVLPDTFDIGTPGFSQRLDHAEAEWFAAMRHGLPGAVGSSDLPSMFEAAGLEVLGSRLARLRLAAPLPDQARRMVQGHLHEVRVHLGDLLDEDDLRTLDVLIDTDDPRGVMHRPDVFVASSRQIHIARALPR